MRRAFDYRLSAMQLRTAMAITTCGVPVSGLLEDLMPADPAGVATIGPILITPDGKTYVYGFHRTLADLYLVEGLK